MIRNWHAAAACAGVAAAAFVGLSLIWLRQVEESDAIVAEARRVLPDEGGASLAVGDEL